MRSIENGISPQESFFVEVLEVSEGTSFEEALTNKADGSFDSPFFVRAARGTGLRLKVVVSREIEQLRVETNSVGQPFDYGRLEIVVQQDSRTSSQFVQRANMTRNKVLKGLVEEELEVQRPGIGKREHEAAQSPRRPSDAHKSEVTPVHLPLLAGEHLHADVDFGGARSQAADEPPKLSNASRITTPADHVEEPSSSKTGVFFERLPEKLFVGLSLGSPGLARAGAL